MLSIYVIGPIDSLYNSPHCDFSSFQLPFRLKMVFLCVDSCAILFTLLLFNNGMAIVHKGLLSLKFGFCL